MKIKGTVMSKRFYIADIHDYDMVPVTYMGFKTKEEHRTIVESNWNTTVNNDDEVFILGDITCNNLHLESIKSIEELPDSNSAKFLSRLNGKKHLVLGNHDSIEEAEMMLKLGVIHSYKHEISVNTRIEESYDVNLLLTHRPVYLSGFEAGTVNVHGHFHHFPSPKDSQHINVSSCEINFTPVEEQEMLKYYLV